MAVVKPTGPAPAHSSYTANQKFLGAVTKVPASGTASDFVGAVPVTPNDPTSQLVKVTPSANTNNRDAVNAAVGASPAPARMSGWTGSLIAPNMRVHDATAAALDHVGQKDLNTALTNPSHPDHQSILSSLVLRDPTLGSRGAISAQPRAGTPVGSASVSANNGNIPATIQSAIGNLTANTQSSSLMSILNQVLGRLGGGGQAATSPAQDDFYKSQTALNNQKFAAQAAPGQIQSQINANLASTQTPTGIMSIAPALPGSYDNTQQNALVSLYGNLNTAKQAASGWTAPTY